MFNPRFLTRAILVKSMVKQIPNVKCYVLRGAFTAPNGDTYVKIVTKQDQGQKLHSFVGFSLMKDGTIKFRDVLENVPATKAQKLIEVLQTQCEKIPKEEFDKAEAEYFRREAELNVSWRESDVFRKHFGIDTFTQKQKDIMDRVSKSLKKPKDT